MHLRGQDGRLRVLDGRTLDEGAPPREAHAGFVSGLCKLQARTRRTCCSNPNSNPNPNVHLNQARTRRTCWSSSLADGAVCVWVTDDIEHQATSERAAAAAAEVAVLAPRLEECLAAQAAAEEARRLEVAAAAAEHARLAAALDVSRAAQQALGAELAYTLHCVVLCCAHSFYTRKHSCATAGTAV